MKNNYEIIIIGAGPSGISTFLNLYERGIKDILIIEKHKFPRYKCCAGYITGKTKKIYESLGLNIESIHYTLIKDFNIFYKYHAKQKINNKFLYTNKNIDRTELDDAFFKVAKKKGTDILENEEVSEINEKENFIVTKSAKRIYYQKIIFADGTLGFGSRLQKLKQKNIALQLVTDTKMSEKIDIHFGITKNGYGWVSSYNGKVNIGLTDVYNKNINYQKIFADFLKKQNIDADIKGIKGAFTPIGLRKGVINNNIYFVGDAVGACDPFTLSGLRWGLKSGEMCAEAIKNDNNKIYIKYINKLKIKFNFMKLIMKIFYLRVVLFMVFNIGCKFFGKIISFMFNNFFINKK